jgi:hypothetical protein
MSDQTESNQPKLTIADPVDADTLKKFQQLQASRLQVAEHLLNLEQEKIRLMRAASNIEAERQRLFEEVLMSRGLPPNYSVEIDGKSGVIKPVEGATEAFNQQAAAQAQLAANQAQATTETPSN